MTLVRHLLAIVTGLLVAGAASAEPSKPATRPAVRVALYTSTGVGGAGPKKLEEALTARGVIVRRVDANDIRNGVLDRSDVLIQPGGSGSAQGKALGDEGRDTVRKFVKRGGGYVGICAGSYLSSSHYTWSLGLINAKVLDTPHWNRGHAQLKVELTPLGKEILGDHFASSVQSADGVLTVLYASGPVLAPDDTPDPSAFQPLAYYRSEITAKGGEEGIMVNSPAIVAGHFGQGRVISCSPHPEQTAGLEDVIPRAVQWVAGRMDTPKQ